MSSVGRDVANQGVERAAHPSLGGGGHRKEMFKGALSGTFRKQINHESQTIELREGPHKSKELCLDPRRSKMGHLRR